MPSVNRQPTPLDDQERAFFDTLHRKFYGILMAYFLKNHAQGNTHDAQDLVQATLYHLIRYRTRLYACSQAEEWQRRFILNAARWMGNRHIHNRDKYAPMDEEALEALMAHDPSEEKIIRDPIEEKKLRNLIEKLPELKRQIMERLLSGEKPRQIAISLGVKPNKVHMDSHRTIKMIRRFLKV